MNELFERLSLPTPAKFINILYSLLAATAGIDTAIFLILNQYGESIPEGQKALLHNIALISTLLGLLGSFVAKIKVDWEKADYDKTKHVRLSAEETAVVLKKKRREWASKKTKEAQEL